jgi:hypothetical protein
MNNAIVCLTRGYKNIEGYKSLIKRNECIEEYVGIEYQCIIFHEGNINKEHQDYIYSKSKMNISFVDISPVWVGGYESMCRFQSYWIWEYCKSYDNIMRVDEDCFIETSLDNVFDMNGCVFKYSTLWAESHSETNATLPFEIEKLTG